MLALAGCSSTQVAVGGAVWAYDPAKKLPVGPEFRGLKASDEDYSENLVALARKSGVGAGLAPIGSATVMVHVLNGTALGIRSKAAVEPDGTFLVKIPGVKAKDFREVEVVVEAPGYKPLTFTFPKVLDWRQKHYDVAVSFVAEPDGR